jgi:hypothetical protein
MTSIAERLAGRGDRPVLMHVHDEDMQSIAISNATGR